MGNICGKNALTKRPTDSPTQKILVSAKIIKIIDGDSFKALIKVYLPELRKMICEEHVIRLYGCDCPETPKKKADFPHSLSLRTLRKTTMAELRHRYPDNPGLNAMKFVKSILTIGKTYKIVPGNKISQYNRHPMENFKRGKFGRLLADIVVGEHLLSELIINAKHGKQYFGGKKEQQS